MQKLKPNRLQKGDTVAIVSPSLGLPSIFPLIYESGLKALENLGLKIKEYPSVRKEMDFLYRNPEFRAKDINEAFADPEVKAIIASIGGDDSVRILPFLDLELIKKNPKMIMGYSDGDHVQQLSESSDRISYFKRAMRDGWFFAMEFIAGRIPKSHSENAFRKS